MCTQLVDALDLPDHTLLVGCVSLRLPLVGIGHSLTPVAVWLYMMQFEAVHVRGKGNTISLT